MLPIEDSPEVSNKKPLEGEGETNLIETIQKQYLFF